MIDRTGQLWWDGRQKASYTLFVISTRSMNDQIFHHRCWKVIECNGFAQMIEEYESVSNSWEHHADMEMRKRIA